MEGQVVGPVGSVMASHPKKDAAANTHRRTAAHTQKTKARNETPQMGLKMHAAQHNK